jgi:hypothetical protein
MNPGKLCFYNFEWQATKAEAPQALSFRGFFISRIPATHSLPGRAAMMAV